MKDIETRKREFSNLFDFDKENKIRENSNYGEFIIQSNEVQLYLILLLEFRSFRPDKSLYDNLERLELGNLIGLFRVCVKNTSELVLISYLNRYKNQRNKLAHKMFTQKKLTITECKLAIELGNNIIIILKKIIISEKNFKRL